MSKRKRELLRNQRKDHPRKEEIVVDLILADHPRKEEYTIIIIPVESVNL